MLEESIVNICAVVIGTALGWLLAEMIARWIENDDDDEEMS